MSLPLSPTVTGKLGEIHKNVEKSFTVCSKRKERKRAAEKKMPVLKTTKQVVPVRTHCHPLIGSFLILTSSPCQRIDGEVLRCQEPARPHWHRIKAGTNAARRQFGKPEHMQG